MNIDEIATVIQGAKDGKEIDYASDDSDGWGFLAHPKDHNYNFHRFDYRVKPVDPLIITIDKLGNVFCPANPKLNNDSLINKTFIEITEEVEKKLGDK